jgi:hypothetical protein
MTAIHPRLGEDGFYHAEDGSGIVLSLALKCDRRKIEITISVQLIEIGRTLIKTLDVRFPRQTAL